MSASLQHIALIMDGNRRWAKEKNQTLVSGYLKGVESLKNIITYLVDRKISYLTLFVFSTENWKRPEVEILSIFKILEKSILRYEQLVQSKNVRVHLIGDLKPLPAGVQKAFQKLVSETKNNTGLNLILAVNYGGRQEILEALNKRIQESSKEKVTEEEFTSLLQSGIYPPPDLVVRTGGVQRLSNFYLWTSVYSEFYFSDLMWPDFNIEELQKAEQFYEKSQRRFGGS